MPRHDLRPMRRARPARANTAVPIRPRLPKILAIRPIALVRLLDRLEAAGLIARTAYPETGERTSGADGPGAADCLMAYIG